MDRPPLMWTNVEALGGRGTFRLTWLEGFVRNGIATALSDVVRGMRLRR